MNKRVIALKRRNYVGFKCPMCGASALTTHTYRYAAGTQRRRHCTKGHSFTTMERFYVPEGRAA